MSRFFSFISVAFAAFALLSVIWIIIPAPSYYIWLYSVAVSEWSLWFAVIASVALILAIFNYAFYKSGRLNIAAISFGIIALLISLYPLITAYRTAREKNVSISFGHYFGGLISENSNQQFETVAFKNVGETQLKMDIYRPPENVAANGAGIIVVHGGSWNVGERNDFPQWNVWLSENGYTVFDIDYTLAPQPNYLAAVGDVKCAVRQVKKRADEFGISANKIVLMGRSAGGHLALMAAYSANDSQIPAACEDSSNIDEGVSAVISFYAPTDLIWAYDHPANRFVINGKQTLSNFIGGSPHDSVETRDKYILASPAEQVKTNTPPTLLIHGGHDQLVNNENLTILADKLKQKNVRRETLFIPYAQHGFDYNFYGWGSQITKAEILEFLSKTAF